MASRANGEGGSAVDGGELFSGHSTAAILALLAADVDGGGGGGGGDRSSAPRHDRVGDDRLLGSGSGLDALRLPPLKLPVSDDGSCAHTIKGF